MNETESEALAKYYARKMLEKAIVAQAYKNAVVEPIEGRGPYKTVAEIPEEEKAAMLKRIHKEPHRRGRTSIRDGGAI